MDVAKREGLAKACRKEKDSRVILRMLAVHMARVRKMNVSETAANLMRSDRWVHTWLERFDAGDLDGLRDLPRSGRSPKIPRETMARIIEQVVQLQCTPRELQKIIREDAGTKLYITNVRKAMRRHGLTSKVPQKVHINKAGKEAVRGWQYRFDKRVLRLERDGFTIVNEDEAFFIYDVASGRKYWSPRGERIVVSYTGSHRRIVVYGTTAKDGRQFFRTHESFDAPTFVGYLKEMQRRFGKVAVVTDRVSPHRAKLVKKLLRENKNIRIIYLPKGSPHLNAVEECWRQGKQVLLVSEYCRTFAGMCKAITAYYRTARFKLDILKFAHRNAALYCTNC